MEISLETDENAYKKICENLYNYNNDATEGLLRKSSSKDICLYLKDEQGNLAGGLFCEIWLYGLYIDVFWISENYRNKGYGKKMLLMAEKKALEFDCTFAHTCTFTYQSPDFYTNMGYKVFGINDEYPNGIKQYFLKKKLIKSEKGE